MMSTVDRSFERLEDFEGYLGGELECRNIGRVSRGLIQAMSLSDDHKRLIVELAWSAELSQNRPGMWLVQQRAPGHRLTYTIYLPALYYDIRDHEEYQHLEVKGEAIVVIPKLDVNYHGRYILFPREGGSRISPQHIEGLDSAQLDRQWERYRMWLADLSTLPLAEVK